MGKRALNVSQPRPHAALSVSRLQKLSQHIAAVIRDRILVGEFPENSVLPPIKQFARELGISQGSLREALRILENDGFVIMKPGPGGGPVVRHPGDEKVTQLVANILQLKRTKLRELHEARYYLELPCARIAARTRTDEDLERLRVSIRASREAKDNAGFLRQTVAFHQIIADCGQNRLLKLFFGCLRDLVFAAFLRVQFDMSWRIAECDEHQRIYEAICDSDELAAEAWMRKHLDGFEPVLGEWFEQYMDKLL